MNLFGLCQNCQLPIFINEVVGFCPYCRKQLPDDDQDFASDTLLNFMTDIRNAAYLEWEEIQILINLVEDLVEINTSISRELGISLIELHKAQQRIEFYQRATTFRIK